MKMKILPTVITEWWCIYKGKKKELNAHSCTGTRVFFLKKNTPKFVKQEETYCKKKKKWKESNKSTQEG